MNTDIRIAVDFFAHHKVRKLRKRIGTDGVLSLIQLWTYAAKLRPDGDLDGMSEEDIELAADWVGEDGDFVKALVDVGFLDVGDGRYFLHDWLENNPWAGGSDARSDASRFSRMARSFPNEYQTLVQAGIKGISKADYEELKLAKNPSSVVQRIVNAFSTTVERPLNDRNDAVPIRPDESNERLSPAPSPVLNINNILKPPVDPGTKIARDTRSEQVGVGEDDPSLEFQELRAWYSEQCRPEGPLAGFVEYKQAKASKTWPGQNRIYDDLAVRSRSKKWKDGYAPSLANYLRTRGWDAPEEKTPAAREGPPLAVNSVRDAEILERNQRAKMLLAARAARGEDHAQSNANAGTFDVPVSALPASAVHE